jgi:hypothetical protein
MDAALAHAGDACACIYVAAVLSAVSGWLRPCRAWWPALAGPVGLGLWGTASAGRAPGFAVPELLLAVALAAALLWARTWVRRLPPDVMARFWQHVREQREGGQ